MGRGRLLEKFATASTTITTNYRFAVGDDCYAELL